MKLEVKRGGSVELKRAECRLKKLVPNKGLLLSEGECRTSRLLSQQLMSIQQLLPSQKATEQRRVVEPAQLPSECMWPSVDCRVSDGRAKGGCRMWIAGCGSWCAE
ncbi:hypothetical protein ACFE04_012526 [Oxalis oulophora]